MNEILFISITAILTLYPFIIHPKIIQKYPDGKYPINMMVFAVGFALILIAVINSVASGSVPVATFFIMFPIMFGSFLAYGLKHRKEVKGKLRKTYSGLLVLYSYVFTASLVLMVLFVPFMPNITL